MALNKFRKTKEGNFIFEITQPEDPIANVLMVDDNEVALFYRGQQFANSGFMIDTATDGIEAIKKIKEHGENYDAVLMNFLMPECDGIEATKLIKYRTGFEKPIIGFSAGMFAHKNFYDAGIRAGMYDCVDSDEKIMFSTLLEALYNNKYEKKNKAPKGFFYKLKTLFS